VRDVSVIRKMRPDLEGIGFYPGFGQAVIVYATESALAAMAAGRYEAWACLNSRFNVTSMTFETNFMGAPDRVRLEFEGVYDDPLLAERYAELPSVTRASAGAVIGDGSTLCVTAGDPNWHYVVDQGSGDCPLGCIDHDYSYFVTTAEGAVTASGSWTTGSGHPIPSWVTDYVNTEACHGVSFGAPAT